MKFTLKRIFSYEHWDSYQNLKKHFPRKQKNNNTLTSHVTSDKNYEWVLNIWEAIKVNTTKDYHDLNFQVDFSLLACMSKIFRKEPFNSFELDSSHSLSTLGYSLDIMLKFPDVKLKLVSGFEKYPFIKSTIRNGTFMICKG